MFQKLLRNQKVRDIAPFEFLLINVNFVAKNDEQVKQLEEQVTQLKITVDALEKERDFYFEKLRSVEQIVQVKADENEGNDLGEFCQEILDILYKTEEGFELPDAVDDSAIEQETF